jgi:hypothetical protein
MVREGGGGASEEKDETDETRSAAAVWVMGAKAAADDSIVVTARHRDRRRPGRRSVTFIASINKRLLCRRQQVSPRRSRIEKVEEVLQNEDRGVLRCS